MDLITVHPIALIGSFVTVALFAWGIGWMRGYKNGGIRMERYYRALMRDHADPSTPKTMMERRA